MYKSLPQINGRDARLLAKEMARNYVGKRVLDQ